MISHHFYLRDLFVQTALTITFRAESYLVILRRWTRFVLYAVVGGPLPAHHQIGVQHQILQVMNCRCGHELNHLEGLLKIYCQTRTLKYLS